MLFKGKPEQSAFTVVAFYMSVEAYLVHI